MPSQTSVGPATGSGNLITIHYHRQDNDYKEVGIWTWDGHQQTTPAQNELTPIGNDSFGSIFQLDRAKYGGSDKIGLIPRLGHNWNHKDGGDKFWTPALGHEVWLVSGKNDVMPRLPDLMPHIETAYIDAPNTLVVNLSEQPKLPAQIAILDQQNTSHAVQTASPTNASGGSQLTVIPKEPLDVIHGRYRIRVEGFGQPVPLVPRGILDDRDLFFDGDARLGATYTPASTTFRLFAPTAAAVNLVLYDEATGGKGRAVQPLQLQPKGLWSVTVPGDLQGKFYVYTLDGSPGLEPTREVLDPYATNAVASSTRARITPLPAPVAPLPPRPAGGNAPTDAVVYEMHVRDFTISPSSGVDASRRGLYPGFAQAGTHLPDDTAIRTTLDHLVELGVTHVELLPVQDFADNEAAHPPQYNWGYITEAYFSPEGMYSTQPDNDSRVRELHTLIEALHSRGIGVILDVVYNHTALDAAFDAIAPGYYYRHLANGALSDGAMCGNEFRTEAPMARKLLLDSLAYWTRQYGVDGYRFDLMALIDQDTVRLAENTVHAINPDAVLYGEPWTATSTPLQSKSDKNALRQLPVGAFNDDFRNALKGSPDGRDPGFIQNGSNREALKSALLVNNWFAAPGQSINYMTCHDNLVLWDKLKISQPQTDDATLIETMKLGYLALFTAQGVPFLHGGEEFARSKGGNNNSYDSPDSVNQVDWTLKRKHLDLFNYTRDAIALRKAHPVFRLRTREDVAARLKFENTPGDKTLAYTLSGTGVPGETWQRVCVILNSDTANAEVTLPDGRWTVALDEHGAAAERSVSGTISVRQKSGLVLYQK